MASVYIENVSKYYYSGKKLVNAVKNLNMVIGNGEIVSILGPSGCGKSSTMRMIAGLEAITEGTIYIDKMPVNDKGPAERNIALAFESYALYQHLTVKENISFCLKVKDLKKNEIAEKIKRISGLLGIEPLLERKPSSLSGGEQQLVSLARAMIRQPSITLLDEPISHLDTKSRLSISLKIRQIHNETGLTMAYVTHNQEEALAIADKIAVMNYGEMQQVGPRKEILEKPKNIFVAIFVGEPSMNVIPCRVREDHSRGIIAESEDGGFILPLTPEQRKTVKENSLDEVKVGLRPVDIFEKACGHISEKLSGTVQYFEFLGETKTLKVSLGDTTQIVAVAKPDFPVGKNERVNIYFNPEKIHLFHPKTGLRLGD